MLLTVGTCNAEDYWLTSICNATNSTAARKTHGALLSPRADADRRCHRNILSIIVCYIIIVHKYKQSTKFLAALKGELKFHLRARFATFQSSLLPRFCWRQKCQASDSPLREGITVNHISLLSALKNAFQY